MKNLVLYEEVAGEVPLCSAMVLPLYRFYCSHCCTRHGTLAFGSFWKLIIISNPKRNKFNLVERSSAMQKRKKQRESESDSSTNLHGGSHTECLASNLMLPE
ncbi:hypothetical protein GWI33_012673 [Rhynchophorus ferrugineus]|uniref:Uncharacterized protein n=1 Tax=Rhynchophorus ferrugineus TaxID=354439 RepID=A0A834I552_RHYFE|nr:hypothetical protein GWI33_012673 [Rhynchophorus ferrugineus]